MSAFAENKQFRKQSSNLSKEKLIAFFWLLVFATGSLTQTHITKIWYSMLVKSRLRTNIETLLSYLPNTWIPKIFIPAPCLQLFLI